MVSKAFCQAIDKTSQQLIGKLLFEMVHPEDRTIVKAIDEHVNQQLIFRLLGIEQHYLVLKVTIQQETSTKQFILYCFDITVEEELTHHRTNMEHLFVSASKVANIGYWQFDPVNALFLLSDEVYKIFLIEQDEFVPTLQNVFSWFHNSDEARIRQQFQHAIDTQSEASLRAQIVLLNGETKQVVLHVLSDKQARSFSNKVCFGFLQDVTGQEFVQKERDFLTCAAEATTAGIVITDEMRNVKWINKGFEVLTGYTLHDVKGHSLRPFLQGKDTDPKVVSLIKNALDAKKSITTQILNYHKTGKPYWNQLIISPVIQKNGEYNFVGVQHNITDQVQAKQKLSELNKELERIVEVRTQLLTEAVSKLKHQALTDPLTGISNRRALTEYYSKYQTNRRESEQKCWLCMFDIDHFKAVNDQYGHQVGDIILRRLSGLIIKKLRTTDYIFRLGGEEFLIVLNTKSIDMAVESIERIRKDIDDFTFIIKHHRICITVSIGITEVNSDASLEEGLAKADALLYQAKSNGRNRVETIIEQD